jgi:hypothetical protein
VPFRLTQSAIIVDAKVNGHIVSLMFDSGFGGTVLLNESIDVGEPTGKMTLRDFVGEMQAQTVKLKSLQLGTATMTPDEPTIVQLPSDFSPSYGQHVDGILGLGAVKNRVTEINFEKKEFVFHPSSDDISTRQPDGKRTFLTKMLPLGGNAMVLPVTTSTGKVMTMSLDTGNGFYATTHRDVLERVGLWSDDKQPNFMRKSGIASGAVDSWSMRMPAVSIFGVPVGRTVWDVIDLPSSDAQSDGTVGFGFLSHFNITFDYARRRVWLENYSAPVENEVQGDLGISTHFDSQKRRIVVILVAPGSPAAEAGIKENDQILSIDGADIEHPNPQQMRRLFEGPVGSTVSVAISRDGFLKRFNLTRKALCNE